MLKICVFIVIFFKSFSKLKRFLRWNFSLLFLTAHLFSKVRSSIKNWIFVSGFSVMGDFTSKLPSALTRQLLKNMFACGVSKGKIKTDYVLRGHRDMDNYTSCPGERFYQEIRTWPHYWCFIKREFIKRIFLFKITLTSTSTLFWSISVT